MGLRARWSRAGFPPGHAAVLSERLLREWLVLLGYEVVAAQRYLYLQSLEPRPGAGREHRAHAAPRASPIRCPPERYLLKARKRVYTLTPIRPRFREKPAVIGGLVKPTTRSRA